MLFAAITFCRLSVQFPGFLYSRGSWKRQALNRDEGLGKYNTVICKRLVKRQRMSPLFVSPLLYCCLLSDCIFFSLSSCLSFLCILVYPAGCSLASGKSLLHSAGIFVPQPTYICTKKVTQAVNMSGNTHKLLYKHSLSWVWFVRWATCHKYTSHSQGQQSSYSFVYNCDYLFILSFVRKQKGWSGSHLKDVL